MSTVIEPIKGSLAVEFLGGRLGLQVCRNFAVRITADLPNSFDCIAQECGDGRIQLAAGDTILTETLPSREKHSFAACVWRYSFPLPGEKELQVQTKHGLLGLDTRFWLNGEELAVKTSREPWGWCYEFSGFSFFVPVNPLESKAHFSVSDSALLLPCVISFYLSWLNLAKLTTS